MGIVSRAATRGAAGPYTPRSPPFESTRHGRTRRASSGSRWGSVRVRTDVLQTLTRVSFRHAGVRARRAVPADRGPASGDREARRRARAWAAPPDAPRSDRQREDVHDRERHRPPSAAHARARPQQDARGTALQRVPRLLPEQRGRILRELLRLLPALSLIHI